MQSVNRSLFRICGLARNILFTLEGVTILLQVYIMEKVPYTVLIGQLFDSIIESKIINN